MLSVYNHSFSDYRGALFLDVTMLLVDKTWLKRRCICYVLKFAGVKSVTGDVLFVNVAMLSGQNQWPKRCFICLCYNVDGVQALIEEALYLLCFKVCRCKISDRRGVLFVNVAMLFVDVIMLSVYKHWLKQHCICYFLKFVGVKSVTGEVLYLLMLKCCWGKISDRRGA